MELNKEKREAIHTMAMSIITTANIKVDKISEVVKNGKGTVLKKRSRKENQAFNIKDLNNLLTYAEKYTSDIMRKRKEIKDILNNYKNNTE